MVGAVAVGHGEGHGDHAALAGAVDGAQAAGHADVRHVAHAHLLVLFLAVHLDLQVLQLLGLQLAVGGVGDEHAVFPAVEGHLGDLRAARHLLGDELEHLGGGEALVDGLLLVHLDAQLRHGVLQAVVHLRGALGLPGELRHVAGDLLQGLQVLAGDLGGDAAAGEHGDVHGAGLHGQVRAQLLADGADVGGDVGVPAAGGFVYHYIVGHAARSGEAGEHAATAAHQAHGLHALHGHHAVHDLHGLVLLLLVGHLRGEGEVRAHLAGVHLGHEGDAHLRHLQRREGQHADGRQQHQRLHPQCRAEQAGVGLLDRAEDAVLPGLGVAHQERAHGRHHRHGHQQRGQQRVGDGQAHVGKQVAGHALHEHDGQEHADGGQRGGEQRAGDRLHALHAGPQQGHALLVVEAVDVLDGHDGVVHQHADAQAQAAQGQHVQRDAGEVHAHEGDDHADGDGEGHGNGGPEIHQEQEQDQYGQPAAGEQVVQHRVHDDLDVLALVHQVHDVKVAVGGHQRVGAVQDGLGHVGGGVGGLLVEGQQDAVGAVQLGEHLVPVVRQLHAGHVQQAHLVDGIQSQLEQLHAPQGVQGVKLVAHAHQHLLVLRVVDVAGGHGEVLGPDEAGHHLGGHHAVQPRVLQGFVPLVVELLAGLGQLRLALLEHLGGLGEAAVGLLAGGLQLAPGVGELGVLVDALDVAAGDDALLQLGQGGVDLGDARVDLSQTLLGLGVLGLQALRVLGHGQRLVGVGALQRVDLLLQLADLLAQVLRGQGSGGLVHQGQLGVQRVDALVQGVDLLLGLGPAGFDVRVVVAQGRQGLAAGFQVRPVVGQELLHAGDDAVQPVDLGVHGGEVALRLGELGPQVLHAGLLGGGRGEGEQGKARFRAALDGLGIGGRFPFRGKLAFFVSQRGPAAGERVGEGLGGSLVVFDGGLGIVAGGAGVVGGGFPAVRRRFSGAVRRRFNGAVRRGFGGCLCGGLCGGFGRGLGGGLGGGFGGGFHRRLGGSFIGIRSRGGDPALEGLDLLLQGLLLAVLVVQLTLGGLEGAGVRSDGGLQLGDLLLERVRVQQGQVVQVLLLAVPLGGELGDLPLQVGPGAVRDIGGGQPLGLGVAQLLLEGGKLLLQVGQLLLGRLQRLALGVVHVHQGLHALHGLGQLIPLGLQLLPLLAKLLDGGVDLGRARVDGGQGVVDLLVGLSAGPGQLAFAVGELGLAVVQLPLHLRQLRVHVLQDGAVEHVDAALLDHHVHALVDQAGGVGRGHAVQGFKGGDQLVLHIVGQGEDVHVVPGDGEDRHRQHVRVQLHGHRRANGVVPLAPQLVQSGGELDQGGVHVRAVVELHDHHGHVVPGGGGDLLHVGERGDGGLHGPGHIRLHLLRRRAHIGGVHHHIGQVHAGQQVGGHLREGDVAQHDHEYDAHDHRIGLFDAVFGKHAAPPVLRNVWKSTVTAIMAAAYELYINICSTFVISSIIYLRARFVHGV